MSFNTIKIIDEIRKVPAGLSKKELAAATGLPWGTLFKAASELTARGILFQRSRMTLRLSVLLRSAILLADSLKRSYTEHSLNPNG